MNRKEEALKNYLYLLNRALLMPLELAKKMNTVIKAYRQNCLNAGITQEELNQVVEAARGVC